MTYAQLVFTGGPVFTSTQVSRPVTAVAVAQGRIVAVGNDEVEELIGPRTEVVDLRGRLLIPGLQDAHLHPAEGGLNRLRCNLLGLPGRQSYLDAIASYAAAHPEREWITGGGWAMAEFPGGLPSRQELDSLVPGKPALLHNRDCHGAWANTRALELAGITAQTLDPADGRIERDPDGTPSGMLHEGAVALVNRLIPPPTTGDHVDALLQAQRYLHSLGITAWQDAILGTFGSMRDASAAYVELADSGRLTARVRGALWWDRDRGMEQVDELIERRAKLGRDRFRPTTVKIMQDGVTENFTASLLEPYLAGCPHPHGLSFVDKDLLIEAVSRLDAEGFQLHFHAIGDRATRDVLDALTHAHAANGPTGNRHHIAHLQLIQPADVARFAALDVTATAQPLWATNEPQMTELTLPLLGETRAAWQYPFGGLVRAGTRLACGSDWPVSRPDPFWGIHVAVNRTLPAGDPDHNPEPFLPGQRLDLATALTAYTAGSAYVNGLDETGTIAVGQLADLALLDRNPFDGPTGEIAATQVLQTYVDGRAV